MVMRVPGHKAPTLPVLKRTPLTLARLEAPLRVLTYVAASLAGDF